MLIASNSLRVAKRLLGRLRYTRNPLPVLTHILVTSGDQGICLTVTDCVHWLETRIDPTSLTSGPVSFLIPMEAMDAACRADKGTLVNFTPRGPRKKREVSVTARIGGIAVTSVHPAGDVSEFTPIPLVEGTGFQIPASTLESVAVIADCASTDSTRQVLNGVCLSPDHGGNVLATDGRRLACCPAIVPGKEIVIPNKAVHVLTHPDFTGNEATITVPDQPYPENPRVSIRSGNHLLVVRTLEGTYPNYQSVVPGHLPEMATISHDRRPGVVAWLRALEDQYAVRLSWEKRGQLTLTHRTQDDHSAVLHVPVEIHGKPPGIAFNPRHLADAFEIGSTLCLVDEFTPGICRHPGGRYCLMMPMRLVGVVESNTIEGEKTAEAA